MIQIGKIIGVHGLKGSLKIYNYAESADFFAPQSNLVLMDAGGSLSPVKVTRSRLQKNIWHISLVDIVSRDQAQELIGRSVWIHRSALPPLEQDTYYWADLLGMAVFTSSGDYLGQVKEIIPTGANDVYVVSADTAAGAREILVPALASVVVDIDIEQHRMRVELPEGLE